jgi:hypothetical protein
MRVTHSRTAACALLHAHGNKQVSSQLERISHKDEGGL